MNTVLLVFMLVNGQPQGRTMAFHTVGNHCRNELQIVAGINQATAQIKNGIRFEASCEPRSVAAQSSSTPSFNRSLVD